MFFYSSTTLRFWTTCGACNQEWLRDLKVQPHSQSVKVWDHISSNVRTGILPSNVCFEACEWSPMTTVWYGVVRERGVTWESSLAIFFRFFQLFANFPFPYRSETIRNGFPVKFRIDIGPERSRKHFFQRKLMKKYGKSSKSTHRPRTPPATYYGDLHCKIRPSDGKFRPKIFSPPKIACPECSKSSKNWAA